jgi:hypothetical protein
LYLYTNFEIDTVMIGTRGNLLDLYEQV